MKIPRANTQKPENNDDCRTLAPFVMTLFDGEADEFAARRARAHLLVCQTCARRWLDWNRSRDLLRTAPVAAPPPHLMWRILMACRVATAPQRSATRASAKTASQTSAGAAMPADFQAQILARTTRAVSNPAYARGAAPSGFSLPFSLVAPFGLAAPLRRPALAVPALAAWMMILQRDVWLPTPAAPVISSPKTSLSAPAKGRGGRQVKPRTRTSAPSLSSAPPLAVAPISSGSQSATPFAASGDINQETTSRAAQQRAVLRSLGAALGEVAPANALASRALPTSDAQGESGFTPPLAAEPPILARRGATSDALTAEPPAAEVELAALSGQNRAPRLRTPRWQSAPLLSSQRGPRADSEVQAPRRVRFAEVDTAPSSQTLRVSVPSASAPQPSRLLAEFEPDDERIEEVRSVVDDFRATLDPDDTPETPGDLPDDENVG